MPDTSPTQPRIGLALGGGGVLGIAHVAVLKVLDEHGIRPHAVAGTSSGALVGAAYCGGMSIDRMVQACASLSWRRSRRRLFPRFALYSNDVMGGFLRDLLPVHSFAELKIPLRIVATDLDTAQMVVIEDRPADEVGGHWGPSEAVCVTGDLIDAVRASCAVPVVFEPVCVAGRRLIDGGLVCNVPAGIVRQMGVDVVVAVDLIAKRSLARQPANILQYIVQAHAIQGTWAIRNRRIYADVSLRPDTASLHWDDFSQAQAAFQCGEAVAREKIGEVLEAIERFRSERAGTPRPDHASAGADGA